MEGSKLGSEASVRSFVSRNQTSGGSAAACDGIPLPSDPTCLVSNDMGPYRWMLGRWPRNPKVSPPRTGRSLPETASRGSVPLAEAFVDWRMADAGWSQGSEDSILRSEPNSEGSEPSSEAAEPNSKGSEASARALRGHFRGFGSLAPAQPRQFAVLGGLNEWHARLRRSTIINVEAR